MNRVSTLIPGLDDLIEGGFVENDVILITGGPGSGKTTFGIQYIIGGIMKLNEPGIYVSLEETPARVIKNMWRFGWDMERLVRDNMLRIIQVESIQHKEYIKEHPLPAVIQLKSEGYLLKNILDQIQLCIIEINAKRIFIDSITSLKLFHEELKVRYTIMELIKNLENMDCTTLLTSETKEKDNESFLPEEYFCEGVIRLHAFRTGKNRERAIEILKMRGVKHDEAVHTYSIIDNGIVVYPTDSVILDKSDYTY